MYIPTIRDSELLLESIDESFGLTKYDFINIETDKNLPARLAPIYTIWGDYDLSNLGHVSLKISKNLGDVYIEKINTDCWVIVGQGTTLHCDDIDAGLGIVTGFKGFLM